MHDGLTPHICNGGIYTTFNILQRVNPIVPGHRLRPRPATAHTRGRYASLSTDNSPSRHIKMIEK
jgi:hypothetical protein